MKTIFVLDIQKEKYEYTSFIVTGRRGDLASNTVEVYMTNNGEPYPLTNLTVFYECVKPDDTVIRDTKGVNMVDAAKGHFAYTFPAEVFSVPGQIKRSFFSIEKEKTFRATTQDFSVLTLCDALTGHIESKPYIAEFDQALEMVKGHRKEIEEANKKIAELTPYIQKKVDETDTKCKGVTERIQTRVADVSKQIDAMDVVKKTGDTITGVLESKSDHALVLGSRSYKTVIHKGAQGEVIFAPSTTEQGDTWDWSKGVTLRTDGTIKQATDTGWILMSINTANASNVEGRQVTRAKRNGDQVSVIGSLKNIKEGQVVFNIPTALRPAQQITDVVIIAGPPYSICEFNIETGGNVRIYNITTDKIIHFSINYLV
ncbi:BppU family phage baseplate upper protein [Bacillus cereus]|uniref:BppU family phage baseplate upper protein n=1 Tax=Bacillus cereus TaxID=1396 RepID=UPI0018F645F3|nr:BppU family phage baseplate upper protein [Bacillus cereus]MBJ8025765.1 BppU family phage baseplate upper protein [Bacillus cereus]MBJ8038149.1 BppU family phage baseplate upper protein [Bacillus cereus]